MMAALIPPLVHLRQLLPGVAVPGNLAAAEIRGVTLDSRRVEPGFLFLAVPGTALDGREYIQQALDLGAVAIAAEAEGLQLARDKIIPVDNLREKISEIAGRFYGMPSRHLKVTGITGTNGKTTCCQLLGQLYSLLGAEAGVIGTLGFGIYVNGRARLRDIGMTTPDAVQTQALLASVVDYRARQAVMEVSSHSLVQSRVAAVSFDTAIFTNLSRDHLDYHGSMDRYADAKAALFRQPGLRCAVINADDPLAQRMAQNLDKQTLCYRYGIEQPADVQVSEIRVDNTGIRARLFTPWGEGELVSQLFGRFNLSNLLAVVTAACAQGWPFAEVLYEIPQLHPVAGRMERVSGNDAGAEPAVIVDYAHTPDALEKALTALREHCDGRLWCVFGCGGDRDSGKRRPMGEIAARLADRVVITSDNPRGEPPRQIIEQIYAGAPGADVFADRAEAIKFAISQAQHGDTVLLAGKGHENYQEVAGVRQPFDDRTEALAALRLRSKGNG